MGFKYGGLVDGPDPSTPLQSDDESVQLHPTGRVYAGDGIEVPAIDGAPTDADLEQTDVADGAVVVWDDTNDQLYVRKPDGTWVATAALT